MKYSITRKIQKMGFALLFFCMLFSISAAQKQYRATWLNPAPVLKGSRVFDEPAWKDIAFCEDFIELATKKKINGKLKFYAGFIPEGFFVRVETPWEKKRFSKTANFFDKDTVEIFLSTSPGKYSYSHFVLNIEGQRWNAEYKSTKRTGSGKLTDWSGAVNKTPKGLVFNFLIPYKTLGKLPPESKDNWVLNIAIHETGKKDKFYSWCNLVDRFHEPRHFGKLTADNLPEKLKKQLQGKMLLWNQANAVISLKQHAEKLNDRLKNHKEIYCPKEVAELKSLQKLLSRNLTASEFKQVHRRLLSLEKNIFRKINQQHKKLHNEIMTTN